MESFAQRKIDVSILANKGQENEQQIDLKGLRCSVQISYHMAAVQGSLNLNIWGMTADQMSSLTNFRGFFYDRRDNEVSVFAGDQSEKNLALIYKGQIMTAFADMNAAPNTYFHIESSTMCTGQTEMIDPSAHKGARDAAEILKGLAARMGREFENNGVSVILRDRTYTGTLMTQAGLVARDADINMLIDHNVLAIWPRGMPRKQVVEINAKTGLVGYPMFSGNGISCTTIFNSMIQKGVTARVKTKPPMEMINGDWGVFSVSHRLESEIVGGAWFTQFETLYMNT